MKLSELVAFRNKLDELPVGELKISAEREIDIMVNAIVAPAHDSVTSFSNKFVNDIKEKQKLISESFSNFQSDLNNIKVAVSQEITEREKVYFQESYGLFEEARRCERDDAILVTRVQNKSGTDPALLERSEEILKARLSFYANWKFAGMIIRPGVENFIDYMVGYDPLYIIDQAHSLLKPSMERWPKLYQNRLRPYVVNDWSENPILEKIPDNQFGMCLAYNVFNFRPLEIIKKYMQEVYSKLRPGGIFIMSFNDCDRASAVILVENKYASYTPGYLIKDLAKTTGFQINFMWDDGGPSVWLELQKPGELISNRGGQTIASHQRIDSYLNDVDYLERKPYTKEEIEAAHNEARAVGISEDEIASLKVNRLQLRINEIRHQQHMERVRQQELEQEEFNKAEAKRKAELERQAGALGIDVLDYPNEQDLVIKMAEEVERRKREELVALRQRAMELQVGDPNLVRYGYSAEKLKQLIREKESK